jgi:hypothetical protein
MRKTGLAFCLRATLRESVRASELKGAWPSTEIAQMGELDVKGLRLRWQSMFPLSNLSQVYRPFQYFALSR